MQRVQLVVVPTLQRVIEVAVFIAIDAAADAAGKLGLDELVNR